MSRNTSEQEQSSPNFLKRKIAAATVLTGIGISALAGCAPTQAEGHEPAPTSSASESSAPTETQTPVEKTPDLVLSYDKLSWADFDTKPQTGRVQYVDYKIGLEENRAEHEKLLSSRNRPTYVELSKDSSPQDILDHFIYVNDEANYQFRPDAATGKKLHDVDSAVKYLSGAYFNVSDSDPLVSKSFIDTKQEHIKNEASGPYAVKTTLTSTETSGVQQGDVDGTPQTYQDIKLFTNEGVGLTGRFIYVEYPDLVTGETEGTWLLRNFS